MVDEQEEVARRVEGAIKVNLLSKIIFFIVMFITIVKVNLLIIYESF